MKKSYKDKLLDPRWQRKRLEILERDEFTCQGCYDTESTLSVHHRYYVAGREPWDYPRMCYVTLCSECHSEEYRNASDHQEWELMASSMEALMNFEPLRCAFLKMLAHLIERGDTKRDLSAAYFQGLLWLWYFKTSDDPDVTTAFIPEVGK